MNLQRVIFLIVVVCMSFSLFGKDPYSEKTEQEVIEFAYNILKVYYPSEDELCVSDSIYDLDWFFFSRDVRDKETQKAFEFYSVNKDRCEYIDPVYSKTLASIFESNTCKCGNFKYVVHFSAPFRNAISCYIVPFDDQDPMFGEIPTFLFMYNNEGEVIQINKDTLYLN